MKLDKSSKTKPKGFQNGYVDNMDSVADLKPKKNTQSIGRHIYNWILIIKEFHMCGQWSWSSYSSHHILSIENRLIYHACLDDSIINSE